MLLKGTGLTIERPSRLTGTAVGTVIAGVALALAVALLIRAISWPASFPGFLAYAGAGMLFALALLFAFWTWSCANLEYVLDHTGITVKWGWVTHFLPMQAVAEVKAGKQENQPKISGLGWYGYHIGRGKVEGIGPTVFFSTHRSASEIVYVKTADVAYALSPQDPARFAAEIERFHAAGSEEPPGPATIRREQIAAHPIWADRIAQYLALAAIAVNAVLWGWVLAVYPDLSNEITIEFPPIGEIATLKERSEILNIPATASVFLLVNLVAGLIFEWRERAATYLVLSATLFFQVLFLVAAAVAISNA